MCVRVACVCLTLGAKTAHLHWSPLLSCVCGLGVEERAGWVSQGTTTGLETRYAVT